MPCIRKKRKQKRIKEKEMISFETILRETCTLADFLNCDATREILEQNWFFEYTKTYAPQIEEFYENERNHFRKSKATLFYYDTCGSFVSHLTTTLFSHIEPKYDLEFFYNNPNLAKPLLDKMENSKHERELEHKRLIQENYKTYQESRETQETRETQGPNIKISWGK